jgi:hypothetical protein
MSGYELPARDLAACGRDGFTGELRVSGSPGGAFPLRGGLVVAVESPRAPGRRRVAGRARPGGAAAALRPDRRREVGRVRGRSLPERGGTVRP